MARGSIASTGRGGAAFVDEPGMSVAMIYDMDACRWPTGVTRHALAQLERLARRPELRFRFLSGRIGEPDGLAYWEKLGSIDRVELPIRTRDALRYWRFTSVPTIDFWAGNVDWVYVPAEWSIPTKKAKLAVTSHDVLQVVRHDSPRRAEQLKRTFAAADLILSVSNFNTDRFLERFPDRADRLEYVPNAADDLFFETATPEERGRVRSDLGIPAGMPYFLSVASFQPRKNLPRLVRAAARIKEVERGEIAVVLIGAGNDDEARPIREAVAAAGPKARIRLPGYRQGELLRAIYAESLALVFPSVCESFGIPAVEAMAQGVPAALANSTALPETGGEAGWYFDPENEESIASTLRDLIAGGAERDRRVTIGREIARRYRWDDSNRLLVEALKKRK
jgi:alpha-1,3-rhamnosyl/mannosyltransferase